MSHCIGRDGINCLNEKHCQQYGCYYDRMDTSIKGAKEGIGLTFNEYEETLPVFSNGHFKAEQEHGTLYNATALAGEVGELCNLIKKEYRGDNDIEVNQIPSELGDILWYLTRIAKYYGLTLEDVAKFNIAKLKERYKK